MKSSKIANVKIILGVLTALALIVFFACEQKETMEPDSQEEAVTIKSTILEDGRIKIEGTAEDMEQFTNMFSGDNRLQIVTDSVGDVFLIKEEELKSKSLKSDEETYFIVEDMPEYPGGEMELRKFIANNIAYPESAQKSGTQGKVYVTFVVDKNGNVANARIARGVDPALDKEALRVVNSLPKWKPGKQRGEAVNVSYTVPINFALQ